MCSVAYAKKLKICHMAATTSGARWMIEQLRELRDRYGHDVAVVLNGTSGALVDECAAAGIAVHYADFEFINSRGFFAPMRKAIAISQLLRRERFDVVQTHLYQTMVVGRIAAWISGAPIRLSMISGPFHLEACASRWTDLITQWMDSSIIGSCEYTLKLYRSFGVASGRLSLIYYGADELRFDPLALEPGSFRRENGWPKTTPLIGMVSIFYSEFPKSCWIPPPLHGRAGKGHEEFIRAASLVLREFPDAKFIMVGGVWPGGENTFKHMQELVVELGLERSVIFAGFRNNIPQIYRDLDVSVQPSLNENLGGSIESLLMECPTVATRVGGLTDSVLDGITGVLVSPGDPADLARGILEILRDPARARALAKAGRQRMLETFTLAKTAANLNLLYLRLAANGDGCWRVWYAGRLAAAVVVCAALSFRSKVLDSKFLPLWDDGWRPWRPATWTWRWGSSVIYLALGRGAGLGVRQRLLSLRARTMIRTQNGIIALRAIPKIWVARAYAYLGAASHVIRGSGMHWSTKGRRVASRTATMSDPTVALVTLIDPCAADKYYIRHVARTYSQFNKLFRTIDIRNYRASENSARATIVDRFSMFAAMQYDGMSFEEVKERLLGTKNLIFLTADLHYWSLFPDLIETAISNRVLTPDVNDYRRMLAMFDDLHIEHLIASYECPELYQIKSLRPGLRTYVVHLHFDPTIFKDRHKRKKYDVIVYGSTQQQVYGFRHRVLQLLQNEPRIKILHLEMPESQLYNEQTCGPGLARRINQSWMGLATVTDFSYLVGKYFEIAASGSVVLGDMNKQGVAIFGRNYVHIDERMSDAQIVSRVRWALGNRERLRRISDRMYGKMHSDCTLEKYERKLFEIAERVANGDGPTFDVCSPSSKPNRFN